MKKSIFLFFAAILCAMTANAYNQSAKDLYFDNSEAKWNSCYVYIGHGTWTSVYAMSRVSGTQYLWKLPANFNGGNSWNGATGWVVCYEKWWDSKNESIDKYTWHGDKNVTQKSTSAWVDTKIYKTNGTASTKSDNHTINAYKVTSYTKNNYTVTINTVEGGTLTVKDYDDNAVATGASKIHLTVLKFSAAPASGYVLDGVEINDGANTTTIAAADLATTTHTLTSAVTITPVWRATTSTVTVTATATNGTVTGGGVVEEGTSVTLTATPADGYKFVNWTVGGAEVSTANPYTFTAEEDVTVVANFEQLPPETVYFVNAADWTGTINIHAWGGTASETVWPGNPAHKEDYQIGGHDVYSLTADAGAYANVIFNNGGTQTSDLVWTAGKYYVTDGWYTRDEAEEKLAAPVVTYDYYITGSLVGGWDPKQQGLEKDGELYKATFTELNAGTYEFKITAGDWEHQWNYSNLGAAYEEVSEGTDGEGNPNGNIKIITEEAKNITVIFDATAGKITLEGLTEKVVVTPDVITYVLMGVGGDWTTGIALTKNETAEYGEEYVLLDQEILEGDAVKVVTLINGVPTYYCGAVEIASPVSYEFDDMGNIVLLPGKYNFYFKVNDPTTYEDDAMYITGEAYPEVPTAIDNVDTAVAPAKVINNGQLIIIRNGVQFNAQGAVVK